MPDDPFPKSKILGGPMHGPSPHLKLWGDRPPSLPRSPPLPIFVCYLRAGPDKVPAGAAESLGRAADKGAASGRGQPEEGRLPVRTEDERDGPESLRPSAS